MNLNLLLVLLSYHALAMVITNPNAFKKMAENAGNNAARPVEFMNAPIPRKADRSANAQNAARPVEFMNAPIPRKADRSVQAENAARPVEFMDAPIPRKADRSAHAENATRPVELHRRKMLPGLQT